MEYKLKIGIQTYDLESWYEVGSTPTGEKMINLVLPVKQDDVQTVTDLFKDLPDEFEIQTADDFMTVRIFRGYKACTGLSFDWESEKGTVTLREAKLEEKITSGEKRTDTIEALLDALSARIADLDESTDKRMKLLEDSVLTLAKLAGGDK